MYVILSDYENQNGVGANPTFVNIGEIAVLDTEDMVVNAVSYESLKKLIRKNGKKTGYPDGHIEIHWDKLKGMYYSGNGIDFGTNYWMVESIWLPSLEDRFKLSLLNGKYSIRDSLIKNNATDCTLDFMEALKVLSSGLGNSDIRTDDFETLTGVGFFELPAKKFKVQLKMGLGLFIDLYCNPDTLQIAKVDIWLRFGGKYKTFYSFNVTGDFKKYMARYSLSGRSDR